MGGGGGLPSFLPLLPPPPPPRFIWQGGRVGRNPKGGRLGCECPSSHPGRGRGALTLRYLAQPRHGSFLLKGPLACSLLAGRDRSQVGRTRQPAASGSCTLHNATLGPDAPRLPANSARPVEGGAMSRSSRQGEPARRNPIPGSSAKAQRRACLQKRKLAD